MNSSKSLKDIFDDYVSKMKRGESVHRYTFEDEFLKINTKYRNTQLIELKLKKSAKQNNDYHCLFQTLYGDMPKYGGGNFKL
ncbi:hypothetical protein BRE01_60490 [Brevibacillus reuszeri]|uniref:Uncharacterized protein n=1 Tax=Brevibacillus reuszeri TaxID=54915 RepID=A0A0K9YN88_9BACL|nr:hypothetical protein [Brevibacillus reuszeri]KNB70208.1 hypothetical protein ADS79_14660 [Brevibacillus reuszeri]MED1859163.1 hypothetical protein [Brevibacillus reuszeri]GED72347.1 hypothetical protein BRE01_60490 [Brevibacillus reuszeri]